MAENRIERRQVQQRRVRRRFIVLALVILTATPALVVGGFVATTRAHFVRLEAEHGSARDAGHRYDAFEHAYASGVVAVQLGAGLASLGGHIVELVEQNDCGEREHDLINNAEGRRLALAVYEESQDDWRRDFARRLFVELRQPSTAFSLDPTGDRRVRAICRSG